MQLCPSCGVVAPTAEQQCAACGARWSGPRPSLTRRPEEPWCVAIRASLQCRACQRLSPLDHLDVDGTARCAHCGVEQAWPLQAWREPVALAAAVGDLGGPDPEGRVADPGWSIAALNPHRELGLRRQSLSTVIAGEVRDGGLGVQRAMQVELAPGHPVCARCEVPLRVQAGAARASTTCPRCGDSREYRNPPGLAELAPGLVGAIAPAHAEGVPPAHTLGLTLSGPRGLSCPGCGAPLPLPGSGNVVTCPFCHLSSRLPDAVVAGRAAEPSWWWLVFRGPSEARLRLLRDPAAQDPLSTDEDWAITPPPPAPASAPRAALRWAVLLGYGGAALAFTGLALALGLKISHQWPPW